ncbi:hypothetical protein ACHAW5_010361 [Stephanodiscus triporus]|uniref:Cyclin N-terminal domain-containing protein n=1 Tax=Stephanodiscus triporus TaxID=2934178 RepID=A0ABD3N8F7_9STRA
MIHPQPQHLLPSKDDPSYLFDHLLFMQEQESSHYRGTGNYLSTLHLHGKANVTPDDRRTMISWSFAIVDVCSIDREMACIGASYFDRFMSTSAVGAADAMLSRRSFQLAFITCLVVALKCRGGMQIDSHFVSDVICRDQYDEVEINATEMEVLRALSWRLNGPSPHEFVNGLIALMPPSPDGTMTTSLAAASRVHVEAALLDNGCVGKPASSLAQAAILAAVRESNVVDALHPIDVLTWMSGISLVTSATSGCVDGHAKHILIEGLADMVKRRLFTRSPPAYADDDIVNDIDQTPRIDYSLGLDMNVIPRSFDEDDDYYDDDDNDDDDDDDDELIGSVTPLHRERRQREILFICQPTLC